jgi:hypothetical protein
MAELELDEIRRRAFRSLYENGLPEIFFGVILLIVGVSLGEGPWALPFASIAIIFSPLLLKGAQRRFVYPRMGYAGFGVRNGDEKGGIFPAMAIAFFVLLVAAFVITSVMGWRSLWGLWSTRGLPMCIGALIAIGPFAEASRFGTRRWYILGAVYLASGFLVQYLPGERHYTHIIGSQLATVGGITLIWGIAFFARFLKKYPVMEEAADDVTR